MIIDSELLQRVVNLSWQAGDKILEVYQGSKPMNIRTKLDNSPVTVADIASHELLYESLKAIDSSLPLVSEEAPIPHFNERSRWQRLWMIDPLDGTKEFIKGNGEFTVNIAFIEDAVPILGVVHAPALEVTYAAARGVGAYKYLQKGVKKAIATRSLKERLRQQLPMEAVLSRSHGSGREAALFQQLEQHFGTLATKRIGSSLKLCLIAEGSADFYPRLAPTSEWDTAAAQALVEQAGGLILNERLQPLCYNTKESMINPFFYVLGDPLYEWTSLLPHGN